MTPKERTERVVSLAYDIGQRLALPVGADLRPLQVGLEAAIVAAVLAEREQCALIAEQRSGEMTWRHHEAGLSIATAIRAREQSVK